MIKVLYHDEHQEEISGKTCRLPLNCVTEAEKQKEALSGDLLPCKQVGPWRYCLALQLNLHQWSTNYGHNQQVFKAGFFQTLESLSTVFQC